MAEESDRETELLKSLMNDLGEKLRKIETFDQSEQINIYCDDLEIQVMEQIESTINHLNQIEKELLAEISGYRLRLLNSLVRPVNPTLMLTDSDSNNYTRVQLDKLSKEVADYKKRWNEYLNHRIKPQKKGDQQIEIAQTEARDCLFKLDLLENQIKNETFHGSLMTFEANQSFCQKRNHLGSMYIHQLHWNDSHKSKQTLRPWQYKLSTILIERKKIGNLFLF